MVKGVAMPLKSYEHCCSTMQAMASLGKVEGVIPILHAPQPCIYEIQIGTMCCRPSRLLTMGTLIERGEIIFGGEENLRKQIMNVYHSYHPKVIVVLNTCVPQLIGEDIKGIIADLKDELEGCRVTFCDTGFKHSVAMATGNDVCWASIIDTMECEHRVDSSVGLLGRSGTDAGAFASLTTFLRRADIPFFTFPTSHIDSMEKITRAQFIHPIHVVPYVTSKKISEKSGASVNYSEIPSGFEGTTRFLRSIADQLGAQRLHDSVDQKEKEVKPEWERLKAKFSQNPVRVLHSGGPASEFSMGKIMAELGAEVFIVPTMNNPFAKKEKELLTTRYQVTFIDEAFDTLNDLLETYHPDVVFTEFQGQIEVTPHFKPAFINMMYLAEYGYDFALDFGRTFHASMENPVYKRWEALMKKYKGNVYA
jgi:nitrogenase molybdenum-iron protein alpha/beta subunit